MVLEPRHAREGGARAAHGSRRRRVGHPGGDLAEVQRRAGEAEERRAGDGNDGDGGGQAGGRTSVGPQGQPGEQQDGDRPRRRRHRSPPGSRAPARGRSRRIGFPTPRPARGEPGPATRTKTSGASGPAWRLARVWIGERATRPPAQAAAQGPASSPATSAVTAAVRMPATADGRRSAVSEVPATRVHPASPATSSGGGVARRGSASAASGRPVGSTALVEKPWLSTNAACSAEARPCSPRFGSLTAAARSKEPRTATTRARTRGLSANPTAPWCRAQVAG